MAPICRSLSGIKSVLAAYAVAVGLTSSAACATDIRFTVATYSAKTGPFFEQVAKDYEAEHPNVHVKIEMVPWDSLYQKLTTDIAAGAAPDMSIIGTRWLYDFAAQGVAEPLDNYMSPEFKAKFIDTFFGPSTIHGKVMGLPVAASARAMMVNLDLFKKAGAEPPKTWDELYQASKKLSTLEGIYPLALMGKGIETDAYFYYALWTFGGDILTTDGKSALDQPAAIKAATFYKKLIDEKLTEPTPTNYAQTDIFNMFKEGRAGMVFTYPMLIPQVKKESPNLKYAILPLPTAGTKATYGVTDTLMLFATSQVKKEDFDFIKFAYQDRYREIFDEGEGFLPVIKAIAELDYYKTNADMQAFTAGLPYAKFAPAVSNWEEMADAISRNLQKLYLGQVSPEQAMKAAASEVNALLSK
jgi:multiple sugar transport system substrate-binding protein